MIRFETFFKNAIGNAVDYRFDQGQSYEFPICLDFITSDMYLQCRYKWLIHLLLDKKGPADRNLYMEAPLSKIKLGFKCKSF